MDRTPAWYRETDSQADKGAVHGLAEPRLRERLLRPSRSDRGSGFRAWIAPAPEQKRRLHTLAKQSLEHARLGFPRCAITSVYEEPRLDSACESLRWRV